MTKSSPQWTPETVPPFTEISERLSVTDYVIADSGSTTENEHLEERYFCLVLDGKHTLFEDMHTLDIRADVPKLTPKDLYDTWVNSAQ
ncbi:MAG: hypothetical protein AAGJ80_14050 [Cyanobacteria bacterium J06553_1]